MKQQQPFRDIVNRDIVNLENCESEPIHIPGSIQPHGFLIAVSADEHRIRFCSGNTKSFIGLGYEDLLGSPLVRIFRWGTPGALLDKSAGRPPRHRKEHRP